MGILSQDHSHLVERSSNHIQFIDILSIQSCFLERSNAYSQSSQTQLLLLQEL